MFIFYFDYLEKKTNTLKRVSIEYIWGFILFAKSNTTYATSHKYITIYKQTTNIHEHIVVYTTDEDKDRERKKQRVKIHRHYDYGSQTKPSEILTKKSDPGRRVRGTSKARFRRVIDEAVQARKVQSGPDE